MSYPQKMSLTPLNDRQKEAVEAPLGPLLVVAGAGTGKTKTLTSRIAHVIKEGAVPRTVCAVTFTNKAAREMEERLGGEWKQGEGPFLGTFHSLGARILRDETPLFGRGKNFIIFDDHDSFQLIKKIAKRGDAKHLTPAKIAQRLSHLKSGMFAPETLAASKQDEDALLLELLDEYEKELERNNAFDFDDLIEKTARLLREFPQRLAKYRARFQHLFIDEYQDVNRAQHALVKLLGKGAKSITAVGDDQQTIYSWRGSDINLFLSFEREWEVSRTVTLDENYRSTPTILAAASHLIAQNAFQKPKRLWTGNPDGAPVTLYEAYDEEDEARWVAEQIQEVRIKNKELRGGDEEKSLILDSSFPIQTTAVLYRTNAQSRAVEQALIERNIPYEIIGGLAFYERREVRDVVAGVRVLENPSDAVSRERIEKNLSKRAFARFLEDASKRAALAPAQAVECFISATGYLSYLEKHFPNASERFENVLELVRFAKEFETLQEFLEKISLLQTTDAPSKSKGRRTKGKAKTGNTVALMTIHLSKGLEFESVFLIGCNEGLLPHARSLNTPEELEEERRLMYVAMTRAKKRLAISFFDVPSRFANELPQELLEVIPHDMRDGQSGAEAHFENDEGAYISIE
jgi:DNA helicase-2/ATP-dependent DNA helicase PcrA